MVDGQGVFQWFGIGRKVEEGKCGGVGFLVRKELKAEVVDQHQEEDLMVLRIVGPTVLVVCVVYQRCERVDVAANRRRLSRIAMIARQAKENGDRLVVGGDFNGHLQELDGADNTNGVMVREMAEEEELIILNCSWPGMNIPTWRCGQREFCLDLVLTNMKGREEVVEGWIGEVGDIVESDHCMVAVKMMWHKRRAQRGRRRKRVVVAKESLERFGLEVETEIRENGAEEADIEMLIRRVARRFEVEEPRNRRLDWWDVEVEEAVERRKEWSREHRRREKQFGRGAAQTKETWERYLMEKQAASDLVTKKIANWNKRRMKEMGRGHERQRNIFRELNRYLGKGKSMVEVEELMDEEGQVWKKKEEMEACITRTWGKLLNTEGEATLNVRKEAHPMEDEGNITREEFDRAVRRMKLGKATDEEGVSGELLKALKNRGREEVRKMFNNILEGGAIPNSWRRSRVVLLHKGGERRRVKNYRPVAISSVLYKLMMMVLRDRIERWMEWSGMLSETQGGFRRGRRTDDNLFVLGRVKEVAEARRERLLVACLDLEKAYDRVNRAKLFDVMQRLGVCEKVLRVLRETYTDNRVRFVLGNLETDWIDCTSGVRQGCPLSPTLFNLYMRDVAAVVDGHQAGVRMKVIQDQEGMEARRVEEWRIGGMLYADDIAVLADSDENMEKILEDVLEVSEEYGMKLSEQKSKVVELTDSTEGQGCQEWVVRGKTIQKCEEVKYLGLKLKGGENARICQFAESMKKVGSLTGMVKYAAKRSGSRFVVGREAWKSLIVGRFLYGVAAVGWSAQERSKAEVLQTKFGRWLWGVETSVRNVAVHGETAWSTFWEREAKVRAEFVARIMEGEDFVARAGRACAEEIGVKSKWWRGVANLGRKLGLEVMTKMVWRRKMTRVGMTAMGFSERELEKLRKEEIRRRIQQEGREEWKEKLQGNERLERYGEEKSEDRRMEKYADGSDGSRVRMMCRGDSLTVRANRVVHWKYAEGERSCSCGVEENERHLLLECPLYERWREEWLTAWRREKGGQDPMEGVLGFTEVSEELERVVLKCVGAIWKERQKRERER